MKRACIATINAARARFYTYQEDAAPADQLKEVLDLVNPGRRLRSGDMFSETRPANALPGRPGIGRVPGSTKDDHRDEHIGMMDTKFAKEIVHELDQLVSREGFGHLILVASPKMLGELRKANGALKRSGLVIDEVKRDLAMLTPAQLHDHLAALDLIPGRQRLSMAR